MKRSLVFLSAFWLLTLGAWQFAAAQDDVYYDPSIDKGNTNTNTGANPAGNYDNTNDNLPTNNNTGADAYSDKSDGYTTPADRYDLRDNNSSNNSQDYTDGYYDEDDDFFYTTRLRRYYTPNYGVDYYSYWFTPSYYFGFSTWNPTYVVSYNPWYSDPWWGWNRRFYRPTVVVYDPFWDWNFGWNSCSYFNSWSNPYWGGGCGFGGFNSWGWNGWGYNNGGFCGGYFNNYGGYYNGYNNGYWNGYYNGYNDGYYNGYYNGYGNNGFYYYGPRHHRNGSAEPTVNNPTKPVDNPGRGNVYDTGVPREGITKPYNPGTGNTNTGGVKVDAATPRPYTESPAPATGAGKPGTTNVPMNGAQNNNTDNRWGNVQARPNTGVNIPATNAKPATPNDIGGKSTQPGTNPTRPFVQENNVPKGWNDAPPTRYNNGQPVPAQPADRGGWQQQQGQQANPVNPGTPNRDGYYEQQRNGRQPQVAPQQPQPNSNWNRGVQRPAEPQAQPAPRNNYQPRNEQPQRMAPQQSAPQSAPRYTQPNNNNNGGFNRMEPRNNGGSFSAPQQRPATPAPAPSRGGNTGGGKWGPR